MSDLDKILGIVGAATNLGQAAGYDFGGLVPKNAGPAATPPPPSVTGSTAPTAMAFLGDLLFGKGSDAVRSTPISPAAPRPPSAASGTGAPGWVLPAILIGAGAVAAVIITRK